MATKLDYKNIKPDGHKWLINGASWHIPFGLEAL